MICVEEDSPTIENDNLNLSVPDKIPIVVKLIENSEEKKE